MRLQFQSAFGLVLSAAIVLASCAEDKSAKKTQVSILPPTGAPVIEITSHRDGMNVFGSRVITFAGTLTSPTPISEVTLALGNVTMPVTWDQASFSSSLTLGDRSNKITVTAINTAGAATATTLTLRFPFLSFRNGQEASLVIGQSNFISAVEGTSGAANELSGAWGHAAFANGTLYLPDYPAHRVLGYLEIPTENGASADFVLGQDDFGQMASGFSRDRMQQPASVSIDNGKMAIAMKQNRVFLYLYLPNSTNVLPDVVVGQADFDEDVADCTASNLDNINSVRLAGNRLLAADSSNNRVLIWNSLPTVNGAEADLVLGQPDLTTCTAGNGPSGMDFPNDVWTDGERVIVTDANNARVLIWNTFPTTNGQAADLVLGQKDLDTVIYPPISASTFDWPGYVATNGNQLFVGDCGNRVLIWNEFPTANSAPADRVLGQSSFSGDIESTTRSIMTCPSGFAFIGNDRLLVTDWGGVRYLMFDAQ